MSANRDKPEALLATFSPEQLARRLSWLLAYLDDRSDVRDSGDGGVQANAEMSALQAYEEQFGVQTYPRRAA